MISEESNFPDEYYVKLSSGGRGSGGGVEEQTVIKNSRRKGLAILEVQISGSRGSFEKGLH